MWVYFETLWKEDEKDNKNKNATPSPNQPIRVYRVTQKSANSLVKYTRLKYVTNAFIAC
jgi:hypothetical protein